MFVSPPKKWEIYQETLNSLGEVEYVVTCYTNQEVRDLDRLKAALNRTFHELDPPDIEDDSWE